MGYQGKFSGEQIDERLTNAGDIPDMKSDIATLLSNVGKPDVITDASDFAAADHSKVYAYMGETTASYTHEHWYYYKNNAWTDGGVWGSAVAVDAELETAGAAADAKAAGGAIDGLKSAFNNALGDAKINIVNPDNPPVNLYPNGTIFSAAYFIYSLVVKVKPNTEYTVMQKTPSDIFRCSISDEYPVLNGTCTIVGGNNNSSPKHFTTGATTQYLMVGYKSTRAEESYTPFDIMVAEGYRTEFEEIGAFELTEQMFGSVADNHIDSMIRTQQSGLDNTVDRIMDDRNETNHAILTSDYSLTNASIVNGIINKNVATMVATEGYIDCRGIKYLEFHNTDKWIYFSWYSEPNESAFVSNSGAWWQKNNLKVIPVNDFLRITIRKPDGTNIQPSFGEMVIDTIGVTDYNAIVKNKQAIAPYGYKVLGVNDKFVRGGISTTGEIVASTTSITTPDYIDTKNAKTLYVSVPEGYQVAIVFFEFKDTKEVQRIMGVTGNRYVSIKNGYNYAKIALYASNAVYTGESKELSVYLLSNCHGYDTQTDGQSGTIVYNDYVPGSELRINSEEPSTIIVSNENILLRDYYEASKTVNGITFTVNDNGSITANGMATANADFYFRKPSAPTIYLKDTPLFFQCLAESSDDYFAYLNGSSQADLGDGVRLSLNGNMAKITSCFIRIRAEKTVNNVTFYPMIGIGVKRNEYVVSRGNVYTDVTSLIATAMRGRTIIAATSEVSVSGEVSINRLVDMKHEEVVASQKQHGWRSNNHVVSICHRGYLTEAPENTIYAFRAAVADDIDYLESDIWFTSDHVPVMFHDPTIDRVVTGHTGTIRDYTWAEVQTFDVSTYFQEQYPSKWNPEYANARIMSFDEYLKFCKGVNTPTMLEIKDPNCSESERQTVINLIRKYDFSDCILWFGSLTSYPNLYSVISAFPNAILNLGVDGTSVTQYHIDLLNTFRTGENNVGIATDNYTANDVTICKANNVPLTVYMIDTLQQALTLDPYIHAALSNNQNVGKVLKSYYMGE